MAKLARCKTCHRWEYLNTQGYCQDCATDEPEQTEQNDGNALEFGE